MNVSKASVENALMDVIDPELGVSVMDLGLIYEVNIKEENKVHIVMTLTTLGCPLFHVIDSDMRSRITALGVHAGDIEIELVFDPPWSMEKMSESAKAMLGI
jgi:metal-sulfur cluster biosynthetic enzyme